MRLDEFWRQKLPAGREAVHWAQVLELLVVNRLIDPGSEFRLHRQWFEQSAMDQLLGVDFVVAAKDRLYRCLDRLLPHRQELFTHLRRRWENLFEARFDLLLYDLTSTYVEGEAELIPKARHGYSRDGRFDCKQVVIALVVTPEGFPLAYEVMAGNTSDRNSLRIFLEKIETMYGKARRVWMMDRGISSEELLAEMRAPEREMFYLVGTPRGKIRQYEKKWLALPWNKVRDSVEVKLFADGEEMYVLAKSEGRQAKEMAIRRRKLARLLWKLRAMRRSMPERDALLMRMGAAKSEAGRAYGFVKLTLPTDQEEVTRRSFQFRLDKKKLQAAERLDGHYLLRTNLTGEDPAVLWDRYIQLTQIEEAFKCLKSELGIRPIHHQVESRVEAHILVAFLGYCLMVTLKGRLQAHAPGLTLRAVLDKLAAIQMLDVWLPITDGRWLVMPRHTEPEAEQALLLHKLKLGTGPGTSIRVTGYHQNSKSGLEHDRLRDYILWFTRWGSWEPKLRTVTGTTSRAVEDLRTCELSLRGLGTNDYEKLPYGHVFPLADCTDVRQLRAKDDVDPLKHYVRTWAFTNEPLHKNPEKKIDFLFAIEGEAARREYNNMLRRQGKPRRPGDYLSEERYGLWLGCDFVPVQRFNAWVSERSEYTRMHAFVNSDDLDLTANRGSVENTSQDLLADIEATVRNIFAERIEETPDYVKFQDELLDIERQRHAEKEAQDYRRRLKRLEARDIATINGVEFYSPETETDVIALLSGVQALLPNLLPFVVRDYDSHFGFDGLATRKKQLSVNETKHLFVEFKLDLKKDFNHSFENLEAILCWTARLKDGESVVDLAGRKGTYQITTQKDGRKVRIIVVPGSVHNVEVVAFKELLEQHGYKFRPSGE